MKIHSSFHSGASVQVTEKKMKTEIGGESSEIWEKTSVGTTMRCEDENNLFPNIVATSCSKNNNKCPSKDPGCIESFSPFRRPSVVQNVLSCVHTGTSHVVFVHRSPFDSSVFYSGLQRFLNSSSQAALMEDYKIDKAQTQIAGNTSGIFLDEIDSSFSLPQPILENTERMYIASHSMGNITMGLTNWSEQTFFVGEYLCKKFFLLDNTGINISSNCDAVAGNKTIPFAHYSSLMVHENDTAKLHIKACQKLVPKSSCIQRESVPSHLIKRALDFGYKLCERSEKKLGAMRWLQHVVDRIGAYISFWGTLISILCSTLSLITFFLLPDTLPSGLFCLCVSFLFSDILYVTVIGLNATEQKVDHNLCYGLAITLHLIGIVVQCCSVGSAVDIAKKFGIVFSFKRENKSFRKYIFKRLPFLIIVPVVVVVLAVTFDYLDIVDMGYGTNGICLFTGFQGRLLFYITPNAVCVVCTSLFVVYTLNQIKKQNKHGEKTFRCAVTNRRPVSVAKVRIFILET